MAEGIFLDDQLSSWLLSGEPWVVYRTLTWLLDREENESSVQKAHASIVKHPLIRRILASQNKDGYWGRTTDIHTWWPKKESTFWLLPVLADFGLDREDERIAKACEYVFSTQLKSGSFGWSPPTVPGDCHTAIIAETLAKLGFLNDPRLSKTYEWLVRRQRLDGGFWCKNTGQVGNPRQGEPSCALASMFVLGAIAQERSLQDSSPVRKGVDFLFDCWENRGKIKYAGHDSQVGTGWEKLKYPFTEYRILKFLDVLSQFEYSIRRLSESEMVNLLLSKRDSAGRFTAESIHKAWSDFDFGQRAAPSRWITLLALRILKRIRA